MTKDKKTNKVVKWLLPEGAVEMVSDLSNNNAYYKKDLTVFFKYAYILHKVTRDTTEKYLAHKESRGLTEEDYKGCSIRVKTLSTILGSPDAVTINLLEDLVSVGLIKRVGGYITGVQSIKYKLTYEPKTLVEMEVSERDCKIPFKIINRYRSLLADDSEGVKQYSELLKGLKIDSSIYSMYSSILSSPSLTSSYDSNFGELNVTRVAKLTKIEVNTLAVKAIEDGDWFCHRPTEGSRVHTNLTNLNRNFRPFLTYEGKELVELDIRNSQPLIASILIKNWFVQKNLDIPADVKEYKKNCENGSFYDYFMELNGVGDSQEDRSKFKIQFFAEIFFSKVSKRNTKLKTQFIEKYPSCYEAICDIKGGYGSKTYNQFAILLQKKEAQLIFDNINMGLIRRGVPAFNIFDSILVPEEHKDEAEELIMTTFSKENLKPTINYTELKTKRKQLIKNEMNNLITINQHGVVFTKASDNGVLMTLTFDSNIQLNHIISNEDFDNIKVEEVDYKYLLKKRTQATETPKSNTSGDDTSINTYKEISTELTKTGRFNVGAFIPSKEVKAILKDLYNRYGLKSTIKASEIDRYYSTKGDVKREDGKVTRGYKILGKRLIK